MSLMPIQPGKPTLNSGQVLDVLSAKGGAKDEGLGGAARTIASVGKFASFIPGVGTAIAGICGAISGFLSFLASPSG